MPVLLLIVGINFIGVGALIPVLPYTVIEMLGLPASVDPGSVPAQAHPQLPSGLRTERKIRVRCLQAHS